MNHIFPVDISVHSNCVLPRQQFAIFKPPEGCDVTTKVHPTQKAAEIKEYDEEPILKMKVEKLAGVGENGVNGKNEQAEPIIAVENDVIDHEEEIVDVVAVSETSPQWYPRPRRPMFVRTAATASGKSPSSSRRGSATAPRRAPPAAAPRHQQTPSTRSAPTETLSFFITSNDFWFDTGLISATY